MAQYLDLEKAVDYLIDETPEGAPFRERKGFIVGDYIELAVDLGHPLHGQIFQVVGTGRNSDGRATVAIRSEMEPDPRYGDDNKVFVVDKPDRRIPADQCRRAMKWRPDALAQRRRYAFLPIVCVCAEGRWRAAGKRPGSARREDIPAIDFVGSEIDEYTGDLMSTPGPTSSRPESTVAIWTELMFSVPAGADEGKAAYQDLLEAGGSTESPGHASTRKSWTQDRTDYWINRATDIRVRNRGFSLLQIARKIEKEDAPDHLPDDQKEAWKKKGWTTENIHRRLKGQTRSPASTKKVGQLPSD